MTSWYVDWAAPDGSIGGFVRIGVHDRGAWCWLYVVDGDGTVVVRDHDVPRPHAGHILARSEGLWCELVCEVADEHWAVNAEAFGVRLDDPTDAWHGEIGHRIPVGLELDWEAFAPAVEVDDATTHQLGSVRGEILLGADAIDFEGFGAREHDSAVAPADLSDATTAVVDASFALHRRRGSKGYLWHDGDVDRTALATVAYDSAPLRYALIPLSDERDTDDLPVARATYELARATFGEGRVGHGWRRGRHPQD